MKKLTTDQFIQRAKKAHKNRYFYSKTIYRGYEDKVIITCPDHGDFLQKPHLHLVKRGCPKCGAIQSNAGIKTDFCKKKDIKLIRIRHKNSLKILSEFKRVA